MSKLFYFHKLVTECLKNVASWASFELIYEVCPNLGRTVGPVKPIPL